MYMCVAMRVYVYCYPPLSLQEHFLEAVLARRPPIISVEGREMDRSGKFERRSLFLQEGSLVRGKLLRVYLTFYCVLRGGEAQQTTRYRTMLVSSWREVGISSRVERVDSQPVIGRSNEVEHLCKNCGPIDLKFCTSSGRACQLYELDRCRTATEVPTLTETLHLMTPPLHAYNEMGGRNPITKLASGFAGAHGAGSSYMLFI